MPNQAENSLFVVSWENPQFASQPSVARASWLAQPLPAQHKGPIHLSLPEEEDRDGQWLEQSVLSRKEDNGREGWIRIHNQQPQGETEVWGGMLGGREMMGRGVGRAEEGG